MTQLVLGRLAPCRVRLGVLTLSFALRPLAPGDPIDALLFGQPSSPQEPFITSYRGCRGTIAGIGPLQMF
jgi:hypothetical protein